MSFQSTVQNLDKDTSVLGTAEMMEEIQIGSERYNLFTGCPKVICNWSLSVVLQETILFF